MRPVDSAVLLMGVFEIPSFLRSQYPANGLRASEAIAIALVAYLLMRLTIRTLAQAASVAALIGTAGACISALGVRQFFLETSRLIAAGFSDFLSFRSRLIRPIPGWLPGECFTLLLLILPFAVALAPYFILRSSGSSSRKALATVAVSLTAVIVASLCLSLSRAVFWGTILLFFVSTSLMVAYRAVSLKAGVALFGGSLLSLALVMSCASLAYPGIARAYLHSETSQARSTHGRLDIWRRSLELVKAHPAFGVGSSNAALFLLSTADPEDTTGFASRSFSLPIQILVEKGIIGFGLYTAFLLLVGMEFHRSMRTADSASVEIRHVSKRAMREREQLEAKQSACKAMKCCFAAGLIAVLFRELTYSSLFEHTLTLALAFTLAALAIQRGTVTV